MAGRGWAENQSHQSVRKREGEAEMPALGSLSPVSFFFHSWARAWGWCCPYSRWLFLHSINPHRQIQKGVSPTSWVILNAVKLTAKGN